MTGDHHSLGQGMGRKNFTGEVSEDARMGGSVRMNRKVGQRAPMLTVSSRRDSRCHH